MFPTMSISDGYSKYTILEYSHNCHESLTILLFKSFFCRINGTNYKFGPVVTGDK
jgi:hypothetical protein